MTSSWTILFQGFLYGLTVAVPIGPVNIEIIRRGLRTGFREAFALGMGAVTADGIYLGLVVLGISRIAQYRTVEIALGVLGLGMLEFLGLMAIRDGLKLRAVPSAASAASTPNGAARRGSLWRVYGYGLAMMAGNPLSMALWLSLSSRVMGAGRENPMAYALLAVAVPLGCASWVVFISTALHFFRRIINVPFLRVINVASGAILCVLGVDLLLRTVFR
jgi:threonine/homoserine/homoserine lactone efflux protein